MGRPALILRRRAAFAVIVCVLALGTRPALAGHRKRALELDAPRPVWVEGYADVPLSMDLFVTRFHGPVCICSVTALRSPALDGPRLDPSRTFLSAPLLGINRAEPTLYRATDHFESAAVSMWCADPAAHDAFIRAAGGAVTPIPVMLFYGDTSWKREVSYDPAGSEQLQRPPASPSFCLFTLFRPGLSSGVAWLQSWLTLGAAHIYLYVNAELATLSESDALRLDDLLVAFPSRVTLMPWPYPLYIGGVYTVGKRSPKTVRNFGIVTGVTSALYRWGHLYTHVGFFDFDEYPVIGSGVALHLLERSSGSAERPYRVTSTRRRGSDALSSVSVNALLERYRKFEWIKLRQAPAVVVPPEGSRWTMLAAIGGPPIVVKQLEPGLRVRRWPGLALDRRHKTFTRTVRGDAWARNTTDVETRLPLPTNHGPFLKGSAESDGVVAVPPGHGYFLHLMNIVAHDGIKGGSADSWSDAATDFDEAFATQVTAALTGQFGRYGRRRAGGV